MESRGEFCNYLRSRIGTNRGARKRLADSIPVDTATITSYVSGRLRPRAENAVSIARYFNDDPVVVLKMLGHDSVAAAIVAAADELLIKHGVADARLDYDIRHVPMSARVAAGSDVVEFIHSAGGDDASEHMKVPNMEEGAYVVVVESNELDPMFPKGTQLIASPLSEIISGRPHIIKARDGRIWAKRVYIYDDHYTLAGPSFVPITLTKDQVEWLHPVKWVKYP